MRRPKLKVFINCIKCDKEFGVYPCRLRIKGGGKYCSISCQSLALKGKHISSKSEFKKGNSGVWLDKKRPDLLKTASTKTMFKKGQRPWNWQNGLTEINWGIRRTHKYLEWRKEVLKRDDHTCIWCGAKENLHVDHIKPFSKFPELRLDLNNGRVLCKSCHLKTDTWGGRFDLKGGGVYVSN